MQHGDPNTVVVDSGVTGPDAPEVSGGEGGGGESLLAGKFKSQEDLERGYLELQKKLGGGDPEPSGDPAGDLNDNPKPDNNIDPSTVPPQDKVEGALDSAGLKLSEFTSEFDTNGKLSADSYTKLEQAGFPKELVDKYIGDRTALNEANSIKVEKLVTDMQNSVGGEQAYGQMMQWAASTLTEAQKNAYDVIMESGDMEQIQLAVAGLHMKYSTQMGMEPSLIGGGVGDSSSVFKSTAEVVKAMSDPRYSNDPAYIAEVEDKLARSNVLLPGGY